MKITKEPSWSKQVKIRDGGSCQKCGRGMYDREIIDAHHIKRKRDYPELADVVENGMTLCMFCHALEHYKMGDYWGCVLILLRLLKLMRKRANWPVITFKEYQTIRVVFHEGLNYIEAGKILGCNQKTVGRRIKKIKKYYPDLLDEKRRLIFNPLPENYESNIREVY